jgi:hypothetical protein
MRHRKQSHVSHVRLFGILACLAAAPAAAQELTEWHRCVVRSVRTLDDGRSDARSVAAAVVGDCRNDRINDLKPKVPRHLVDGDVETNLARLVDAGREQDVDYVSAVVLERRRR